MSMATYVQFIFRSILTHKFRDVNTIFECLLDLFVIAGLIENKCLISLNCINQLQLLL